MREFAGAIDGKLQPGSNIPEGNTPITEWVIILIRPFRTIRHYTKSTVPPKAVPSSHPKNTYMTPRLFIVEDQVGLLETLRIALPKLLECEIAGVARNGADALKKIPHSGCHVAWLDVCMDPLDGPGLLRVLRARGLDVGTVLFTGLENDLRIREAMAAEPNGFVHKADEFGCWREAFQAALNGSHYISARIAGTKKRGTAGELSCLSDVERAVLVLAVRGQSKEQIAAELGISPHTARHHRERLMGKLGVNCIEALCAIACRAGLIDCLNPLSLPPEI